MLYRKLRDGFNIGINHRLADEYWHIYLKQTDQNGTPLAESEWRIRAEKNVKVNVLSKMDNRISNIKRVLLDCFKGIRFTQLKKSSSHKFKQSYSDTVETYGMEKGAYFDANRNLRKLCTDIEMNADSNEFVTNAVCNLAKNFDSYS